MTLELEQLLLPLALPAPRTLDSWDDQGVRPAPAPHPSSQNCPGEEDGLVS